MKEIKLTHDKIALVDDEDFYRLNMFEWYAIKNKYTWYAGCSLYDKNGRWIKNIFMHRVILDVHDSETHVDHRDGNGLNNTRDNIRVCTSSQNQCNRKKPKNNKSGYKGVFWRKETKKWRARIVVNYKRIHLGYFDDIIDAARAYDMAAIKYHGSFAKLNFEGLPNA